MAEDEWTIKDLFSIAIQAEKDAQQMYGYLEDQVKNAVMKDRFAFLADEEVKHELTLKMIFDELFPGERPIAVFQTPVPLPNVVTEGKSVTEIVEQAMQAELAAEKFYEDLSEQVEKREHQVLLRYLSRMESAHYNHLKAEADTLAEFDDFDQYNELMHAGP